MATREIPREEWKTFFDGFSRMHENEQATVREIGMDVGDQVQADRRTFVGISADDSGSEPGSITVIVGTERGDNIDKVIASPVSVFVREGDSQSDTADVEIRQDDGPTLILQLQRAPALSAGQ